MLFEACAADDTTAGVRDSAILGQLKVSGLRWGEISALQVNDYEAVKGNLTVRGKGNKTHIVPIEDAGAKYDRHGERAKRAAVQKLHVPYQRRYGHL